MASRTRKNITKVCDTCEINRPNKFCLTCELHFCPVCIKGHQKMRDSSKHDLRDLSLPKSGKLQQQQSQYAWCKDHPDMRMTFFCKSCLILICRSCFSSHRDCLGICKVDGNYDVGKQICQNNARVLKQYVQGFKAIETNLYQENSSFVEAISLVNIWEVELIDKIHECAKELRDKLAREKCTVDGQTSEVLSNLDSTISEVENQIVALEMGRLQKHNNLVHKCVASQRLVSKVENLKEELIQRQMSKPTVSDILPFNRHLLSLHDRIENVFSTFAYCGLNRIGVIPVASVGRNNPGYRIAKPIIESRVLLHGYRKTNACLVDLDTHTFTDGTGNCSVHSMLALSKVQHVAINGSFSKLCVLDDMLKCPFTWKPETSYKFSGICHFEGSQKSFAACQVTTQEPHKGYFSLMRIHPDNSISQHKAYLAYTLDLEDCTPRIASINSEQILILSRSIFTELDFKTGEYNKYDMTKHLKSQISCFAVDIHGNVLVGDVEGMLHVFDRKWNVRSTNLEVLPTDITVNGDRVYITTKDTLLVYS